jgi:hypothetical protein
MVWRALIFFLSQAKNQLNKNSTFESLFAPDHSLGLSIRGLAVAPGYDRLLSEERTNQALPPRRPSSAAV